MGYYTYITGGGVIAPPIDDALLKPFTTSEGSYFAFVQHPGNEDVEIIDGQVTVVGNNPGSTSVDFGYDESTKAYNFNEEVGKLVDLVAAQGASFTGAFYGDGEESDDFWKIDIEDNEIRHEAGEITYPSDLRILKAEAWDEAHKTLCTLHGVHKNCHTNPYRK